MVDKAILDLDDSRLIWLDTEKRIVNDKVKKTSCSQLVVETVWDWEHGREGRYCTLEFGLYMLDVTCKCLRCGMTG